MATGKIGHYTIVSELGRGGMGVVYKAHEESLNRFVAIKVLGEQLSGDPSFVTRFVREAQAAAALSHPNIIQIFFIGEDNGRHYFVMEYVKGKSLLAMVKEEGRIDNPRATQFVLQAANGLAAAHDRGFLHRDIKPANLLVDESGRL
jgi:serine/threonine protein kinase